MELEKALAIAEKVKDLLVPACEKVVIAGEHTISAAAPSTLTTKYLSARAELRMSQMFSWPAPAAT